VKIFITGNPGCGKTTLIKEIVLNFKEKGISLSGFITEEMRKGNTRVGFGIQDLKTLEKKNFASIENVTQYKFGKYYLDLSNFESIALKAFQSGDFVLIDEIGKMEFYSTKFKSLLLENLDKDINIIATLHRDFVVDFKKYGKVFYLTKENFENTKEEILKIISQKISGFQSL
jgi:nucleoside-triphosphatase